MAWILGLLPLVFLVLFIAGAVTGRVSVTSCCAVGDASKDMRMRAAFEDEPARVNSGQAQPGHDLIAIGLAGLAEPE